MLKCSIVQKIFGLLIILFVFTSSTLIESQKTKEKYLLKLGEEEFFEEEFRYYFFKNNNSLTKDSVKFQM